MYRVLVRWFHRLDWLLSVTASLCLYSQSDWAAAAAQFIVKHVVYLLLTEIYSSHKRIALKRCVRPTTVEHETNLPGHRRWLKWFCNPKPRTSPALTRWDSPTTRWLWIWERRTQGGERWSLLNSCTCPDSCGTDRVETTVTSPSRGLPPLRRRQVPQRPCR